MRQYVTFIQLHATLMQQHVMIMRKCMMHMLVILLGGMLMTSCFKDDKSDSLGETSGFLPGDGIVSYTGYAPLASRPVRIHYHIPTGGNMSKMPVLFVFPGQERNAGDYLSAWRNEAEKRKIMVFAFEFPEASYTTEQYIEGGMFNGSTLLNPSEWTFAVVESVFDAVRKDTGSSQTTYDMWGHSAGAQFVHRYVTFVADARINRAVSANAGWYTLPDLNLAYPYGLKNTGFSARGLSSLFGRNLMIHLGTADTSRSGLNTSSGAEAQGPNRYQRGTYYFAEAVRLSWGGGHTFRWEKYEVAGVAHEFAKMAAAAANILY